MRCALLAGSLSLVGGAGAVPASEPGELHHRIDALILEAGAGSEARAPMIDDAGFLRRVHLDFAGVIPTAEETRRFLGDPSPGKRTEVIDRLLESPAYAATMRDRFHIHLMERRGDDATWLAWLETAFRENRPWDRMVREMIRADFRDEPNRGAAYFYSRRLEKVGQNPTDYPGLTRDVGRLFLGMDLQCAECHNHRLIKDYDQVDFQGMMAAFANLKLLRLDYPAVEEQLMTKKWEYASVFTGVPREVGPRIPGLDEIELAVFEPDEAWVQAPDRKTKTPGVPRFSPLEEFAEHLPESPTFSRNLVNRAWFLMMGRGLVEPLDQFHAANPATHPELLDLLAVEFERAGFDLKWLFRELALTETYQRSSRMEKVEALPSEESFLVAMERRLSAEQLLASTLRALGIDPAEAPLENREAPEEAGAEGEDFVGLEERFHLAFANEEKDPEHRFAPGMKAALFALNDPEIATLLRRDDALPARLASETSNDRVVESLFLAVFSREPQPAEVADVVAYLEGFDGSRFDALVDVTWAMLTSTEFVVNH